MLSIESPPNSKKLSFLPTSFNPSTRFHTSASSSSSSPLGSSCSLPSPPHSTSGSFFRSSFPCAVSPITSTSTNFTGTMYSGSFLFRYLFTSSTLVPPLNSTYPTSLFSPPSPFSTTALCFPPSCSFSTASISPPSIRYPLIFTCSSTRPAYSISSPSLIRPLSPDRYILAPATPLHSSGRNLSAVCSASFTYPLATPP